MFTSVAAAAGSVFGSLQKRSAYCPGFRLQAISLFQL